MNIPRRIPLLRLFGLALGLYAAFWMALEGSVASDVALAAAALALLAGVGIARLAGGRELSPDAGVALGAVIGLVYGAGLALLTLFLMALKTGLHAHGPEYSAAEIAWVWRQLPLWAGAGVLAGAGLALLAVGLSRSR